MDHGFFLTMLWASADSTVVFFGPLNPGLGSVVISLSIVFVPFLLFPCTGANLFFDQSLYVLTDMVPFRSWASSPCSRWPESDDNYDGCRGCVSYSVVRRRFPYVITALEDTVPDWASLARFLLDVNHPFS